MRHQFRAHFSHCCFLLRFQKLPFEEYSIDQQLFCYSSYDHCQYIFHSRYIFVGLAGRRASGAAVVYHAFLSIFSEQLVHSKTPDLAMGTVGLLKHVSLPVLPSFTQYLIKYRCSSKRFMILRDKTARHRHTVQANSSLQRPRTDCRFFPAFPITPSTDRGSAEHLSSTHPLRKNTVPLFSEYTFIYIYI